MQIRKILSKKHLFTATEGVAFYFSSAESTVIVNGGTFTVKSLVDGEAGTLVINGGTFNVDPSAYVASGKTVTNNGDGTWTVQ